MRLWRGQGTANGGVGLLIRYPAVINDRQDGPVEFYLALGSVDNLVRVPYPIFWLFGGHR
jgi:hypothetical protein